VKEEVIGCKRKRKGRLVRVGGCAQHITPQQALHSRDWIAKSCLQKKREYSRQGVDNGVKGKG
jgi:hypothetical protein